MRHFADFEIYECRECRLFVNEKFKESDVNNVNKSSLWRDPFPHADRPGGLRA
jgi:hypothetical protein